MKKKIFIFIFLLLGASFFIFSIQAQDDFSTIKIFNSTTGELEKVTAIKDIRPNYSFALVDLGGDGQKEILIGAGTDVEPLVKIYRFDGSLINSFLAYGPDFKGGVNVSACNFDNDNLDEILTSPFRNGSAHIRIFDGYGHPKINAGFFAFDKKELTGAQSVCADINGDKIDEIVVVGTEKNIREIRIFDVNGKLLSKNKIAFVGNDISLSSLDLGGDGIEEILIAGGRGDQPLIKILRGDLSLVNEFLGYADKNFKMGLSIFGADVDNDGKGEIVVTPGIGGKPQIEIFDGYGNLKNNNLNIVFADNFLGGLKVAVGNLDSDSELEFIAVPKSLPIGKKNLYKYIDIDVSGQKFLYYQNGYLVDDLLTSTGKPSTPTRLGEFTAFSKYEMAYGGADGQRWGMPYFIGFYKSGGLENGIHELPFLDGRREGERSLGVAVSHGCVRLGIGRAREVYDWLEINKTKVFVHK
ncbi:MAG TPA: L,D-transpeptidase [bacterium]|nr:L,D-transpeptidase [bacterium]